MPNINPQEYYDYYDKIFANKNYREESRIILEMARQIMGGRLPKKIIDIGCGTGSHDLILAESDCSILGIDIDKQIINIAQKKIANRQRNNTKFHCLDIKDVEEKNFDLAISLFNVVNYIEETEDLNTFFRAIAERLVNNGVFIFDSWNGVTALLDNPQEKRSSIGIDGEEIEIHSIPTTNLMDQIVRMNNEVIIKSKDGTTKKYNYSYNSTLWTVRELKNALNQNGLKVLKITAWMQPDKNADHKDWKINFICQKKN